MANLDSNSVTSRLLQSATYATACQWIESSLGGSFAISPQPSFEKWRLVGRSSSLVTARLWRSFGPFGRAHSYPGRLWLKQPLEHPASMRAAFERVLML